MTGWTVRRGPNGIVIYKGAKNAATGLSESGVAVEVFLDEDECNELAETIRQAQDIYWHDKGVCEFEASGKLCQLIDLKSCDHREEWWNCPIRNKKRSEVLERTEAFFERLMKE